MYKFKTFPYIAEYVYHVIKREAEDDVIHYNTHVATNFFCLFVTFC